MAMFSSSPWARLRAKTDRPTCSMCLPPRAPLPNACRSPGSSSTKSTVPVGTADRVRALVAQVLQARSPPALAFSVASNPEFLKRRFSAVQDFMRPDRVIVGTDSEQAAQTCCTLYAPFMRNRDRLILMDIRSAEFTKYAANAMLATRISFMNELALLAETGADIEQVRTGIGTDPRIGTHFYAGTGYGGSCLKDVKALVYTAREAGQELPSCKPSRA